MRYYLASDNRTNNFSMLIWSEGITVARFAALARATAVERCGIVITEMGEDWLKGTLTVTTGTQQANGTLHTGAAAVLAESLASTAANGVIDLERFACLGQQISSNYIKTVPLGATITGTTRPLSIAAKTQVWGVNIVAASGELVCVSRVMMAVVPRAQNALIPVSSRPIVS
mgnify:FL=1